MNTVLLDENLPRRLKWKLNADTVTVTERGWNGIRDEKLLRMAAPEFDAFLTMNQNVEYEQHIKDLDLCVIAVSGGELLIASVVRSS